MIPYGKQDISQQDIDAVIDVLQSDFLTQGHQLIRFEKALETYCRVEHAVAVNSATSALHLACLALGLGVGDLLWTTPITFVASANCARYCGADVDFVDIDPVSYNLDPIALEKKLKQAKKENRLPKVIVPVHLAGQSCDMAQIKVLSEQYGFSIIEDASHAIGAQYRERPVGGCQHSDITVFSFHPVKIVTTAEGGAAVTNRADLAENMRLLRSHGITRDEKQMTKPSEGFWYYQQIALGFNYRMTELQAALGVSQLDRLDEFVASRHYLAEHYRRELQALPLTLPEQSAQTFSSWHIYIVLLNLEQLTRSHKEIFTALREKNIGVNLHYIPVYLQPYYQMLGFSEGYCPVSENFYSRAITLPLYPGLSKEDQLYIIQALREVLQ